MKIIARPLQPLALLFAVASPCFAQDLSKPITYRTYAKPLPAVLADLSKQTGIEFTCSTDFDREPLILKLTNIKLQRAMEEISKATAGGFVKTDHGFRLQTSAQAQAMHEKAIDDRAKFFSQSIQKLVDQYHLDQPFDENAAKKIAETEIALEKQIEVDPDQNKNTPMMRALFAALQSLDPREVAQLRVGQLAVFSSKPGPLERPLANGDKISSDFVERQAMVSDSYDNLLNSETVPMQTEKGKLKMKGAPTRVVLTLDVYGPQTFIPRIEIEGCNARATYITFPEIGIPTPPPNDVLPFVPKRKPGPGLDFRPITAEIASHIPDIWNMDSLDGLNTLSKDLQEAILHPTTHEPLSFATSDLVLGYADANHLDVAFCPTDACEEIAYQTRRDGPISEDLFRKEMYKDQEEMNEEEGCLIGCPRDPIQAREDRMPRDVLESYLQEIASQQFRSVENVSDFERKLPTYSDRSLAEIGMYCLIGQSYPWPIYRAFRSAAAFYGTLSEDQQKKVDAGKLTLAVSDLNQDQVELLHTLFLNLDSSFSNEQPGHLQQIDAVQALAGGLDGAKVEITVTPRAMATMQERYRGEWRTTISGYEWLAMVQAHQEIPGADPGMDMWQARLIRPAVQRMFWIKLIFPNGFSNAIDLVDYNISFGKGMSFQEFMDSLSAPDRAAFQKTLDTARKAAKDEVSRPQSTGKTPPP